MRNRRGPATVIGERTSSATAKGWKARRAAIREPGDSRHRARRTWGGVPRRERTVMTHPNFRPPGFRHPRPNADRVPVVHCARRFGTADHSVGRRRRRRLALASMTSRQVGASKCRQHGVPTVGEADSRAAAVRPLISRSVHALAGGR